MSPTPPTASEVIDQLLSAWRANAAVEAVLLFGSHAHGIATDRSDIDLYVLASDPKLVDGDGLHWLNGYVVEAFINTRAFFEQHFERFHADHSRVGQSQFASAKLLFDRQRDGAAIQDTARQWLAKPRVTQTPEQAYWPKRIIWSRFHRLETLARSHAPGLRFAANGFIYDAYSKYAAFLGQPVMPTDRLEDYLADPAKRDRYLMEPFPDVEFGQMLLRAIREESEAKQFELATALKDRVLRAMGGFEPQEMIEQEG